MVTVSFMSFINMLNSKGLRRLPCGTPHRTGDQLEHLLLHITPESCHLSTARCVKLWSLNSNLFFKEPHQLTKFT